MLLKKIDSGNTELSNLHEVFKLSKESFEQKKARLFPNGNVDNETATTSIFLASLSAIKEYREELLSQIGINRIKAKTAKLHVFTEIPNPNGNDRPDGLIVLTTGIRSPVIEWSAFVETKVGKNQIDDRQMDRYIEYAKSIGVDSIITISNALATTPFDSPVNTKKTKVELFHWSWTYLKVCAFRLIRTDNVEDEDHAYILSELRRFMDEHKLLSNYTDMGSNWKTSISELHATPIGQKLSSSVVENIVSSYIQEEKDLSLQLTDNTDYFIEVRTKGNRAEELESMLCDKKSHRIITSTFTINQDKHNTFDVEVNFDTQSINCIYRVEITSGKAKAQTTKLLKTLEDIGIDDEILIKAFYPRNKCKKENAEISIQQLNKEREEGQPYSVIDQSIGNEIKYFEIKTRNQCTARDFQGQRKFVEKIETFSETFVNQLIASFNHKAF